MFSLMLVNILMFTFDVRIKFEACIELLFQSKALSGPGLLAVSSWHIVVDRCSGYCFYQVNGGESAIEFNIRACP